MHFITFKKDFHFLDCRKIDLRRGLEKEPSDLVNYSNDLVNVAIFSFAPTFEFRYEKPILHGHNVMILCKVILVTIRSHLFSIPYIVKITRVDQKC